MKHLVIVLLAVLAYFACNSSASNSTWGHIGPYDPILDHAIVVKKGKWLRIVTKDYDYPKKGGYNYKNITGIRVIDQYTNGNGGMATLLKGGPGFRNVTIHLKSQRSHGFNFIVDIYGRH
ncbi:unnamed protein product [Hermetia illucens]|uniref:Salivary secreted peptide n=1 Tax=Hermetia illucens TaxID=343691 RepID=A0A7R8YVT4_HERIL|nr:probable salivary secreted peptide [Hermetia illucens]CAD7086116.1 unnamed protein product [Hermetia illucens]